MSTMNLDLNEFSQHIFSWKSLSEKKDEEIQGLQKHLLFANEQNEVLENSCFSLLHEVVELNNAITALRNSFSRLEDFEADKAVLLEEKQKLIKSVESLEKLYNEQNKKSREELEKLKQINKEEKAKLISSTRDEASKQLRSLENRLEEKESTIRNLKGQISSLLNQRDEDMLKLKIQYEERIGKLKQQIPKTKVQNTSGLQIHDIFRQKYLKLEKESNEEIAKLKEKIKSSELHIESLKSKNANASLSSVLLTSNKQSSSEFSEISCKNTEKILSRPLEDVINKDQVDDDFSVLKRKFNKTEAMLPQKRKLFNLNQNYFVK